MTKLLRIHVNKRNGQRIVMLSNSALPFLKNKKAKFLDVTRLSEGDFVD